MAELSTKNDAQPAVSGHTRAALAGALLVARGPASYLETTMHKALHINPDKCTGCLQCEMACSYENYGVFNPAKSRIKVFDFHHSGRKVPYTCTQCDEAWCLHACPVDAIQVDASTGAKIVLESVCVGCKVCTIACPFGTVNYVQDTGKVQKCDLCGGNPACAEACPTGAITYIDADWTGLERMKQWADKLGNQPHG
jgi:anaerobic carbon-monoxide dehydrogenase iron sulfur subunit